MFETDDLTLWCTKLYPDQSLHFGNMRAMIAIMI